MSTLKFTENHDWVLIADDNTATVGITDYAQEQLGDLVYVELPDVHQEFSRGEETAVIESVKAASEVKTPLSGTVLDINESLKDEPRAVNEDPMGEGWFFKLKLKDPSEVDELMDEDAYQEFVKDLG